MKIMFKIIVVLSVFLGLCHHTSAAIGPSARIVGGQPQGISMAPYQVSILYKKNATAPFEHRCAGTIYSSNTILTTATCLVGLDSKRVHVKAGTPYRTNFDGLIYLVDKYLIHPDYNIWFTDNDLALIKLAINLTQDKPKAISVIAVASEMPKAGSKVSVSGWGSTDPLALLNYAETLQTTQVFIMEQAKCKAAYGQERITDAMFCAGAEGRDACVGDAGGALVFDNQAVGLVSWGFMCGSGEFPGVYTNLVWFKDWIETEAKKM